MKQNKFLLILLGGLVLTSCASNSTSSTSSSSSSSFSSSQISNSSSTTTSTSSSFLSSSTSSSTTSSSSSSATSTSSSTSSNKDVLPEVDVPETIDELKAFISSTSAKLSYEHEGSYNYTEEEISDRYGSYGNKSVLTATGNRLNDGHIFENANYKKYEYDRLESDFVSKYEYNYQSYNGSYNDKNISLTVVDSFNVSESYYLDHSSSISLLDEEKIDSKIISSANLYIDECESILNTNYFPIDGSFELVLSNKDETNEGNEDIVNNELTLNFTKEGFLKILTYKTSTYTYDWINNKYYDYAKSSLDLSVSSNYVENFSETVEDELNPANYILSSTDIQLINPNEYYDADKLLDNNNIKVGTTIEAKAINYLPEAALDTKFEITSSSNEEVVSFNGYSWKAVGTGSSSLILKNELGLEKEVDVIVVAQKVESFTTTDVSSITIGENKSFSIYSYPTDAEGTFEVTSSDPTIIKVSEGYSSTNFTLTGVKAGTATISIKCLENPSLNKEITIIVIEKLNDSDIENILTSSTWTGYENSSFYYYTFKFNSDGTGSVGSSSFTWSVVNQRIIVGTFEIDGNYFTSNTFTLSNDGSKLTVSCYDDYYWSSFSGTFYIDKI